MSDEEADDDEDESFSAGRDPFSDGVDVVRVDRDAGPVDRGFRFIGMKDDEEDVVEEEEAGPPLDIVPDENLSDSGSMPPPLGPLFC